MSNLLEIEESEKDRPILCIFGNESHILEEFLKDNSRKFRIILVAGKRFDYLEEYPDIYFLTYKNAELLPKLQEKIHYTLVFLDESHTLEQLLPLIEKVTQDRSQTLVVANLKSILTVSGMFQRLKGIPNVRFGLVGEVLTEKRKTEGDLSKIIENAIINGEIRLLGNESFPVYGVSLKDALHGISRLLFGNFKKESVHYLFYKHPETILEASHLIARVEPEIKILFSDAKGESDRITRDQLSKIVMGNLSMEESYVESLEGFEKTVQSLFLKREEVLENFLIRSKKKKAKKKKNRKINKAFGFAFASLIAGAFLFIFLNLLFFGLGVLYLQNAVRGIQTNNFANVTRDARIANFFLTAIKPTVELSFDAAVALDFDGRAVQTYRLLQKAVELSDITGVTVFSLLTNSDLSEQKLSSSLANFSYLYQEGQRVAFRANNKELSDELKGTYSKLLSLSQVLPVVLGFDEEKNYLVLFQNDEELRPTGGFIGSIGNLTVKEGRVEELTIQDVYELDGQLRHHVEPPFVVRRYLQPHLYLRDSNFSLNFQESASRSALLYNLETGSQPDAVIAVNLQVLKELLRISGPITLPSYNVTVNSDSISGFIQGTIKENFFPGSTQKKDVLNSVFNQIVQKFENDPKFNVEIVKLLPKLFEEKDILVSFSDASVQKVFSANGYGGEHSDTRGLLSKSVSDYLYVNEANIGINKVNAKVERKVDYRAIIGQGSLLSEAKITFANTSMTEDYKTYMTLVVPKGSSLKHIKINDDVQTLVPAVTDPAVYENDTFAPPAGLETEQYTKDSFTYFSLIATAKRNSKTTISIEYNNGAVKPLATIVDYSLLYIKQPGTRPYSLTTTFNYPEDYAPVGSTADSYGKNFLEKTTTVEKDYIMEFELHKN